MYFVVSTFEDPAGFSGSIFSRRLWAFGLISPWVTGTSLVAGGCAEAADESKSKKTRIF
jgi:hypothetical protein